MAGFLEGTGPELVSKYGSGTLEKRKSYKAINTKDNSILVEGEMADDALEFINPIEIQAAVNNLVEVLKQECADLEGMIVDPSPDGKIETALVVNGLSMKQKVVDLASHIHYLPDSLVQDFYKTHTEAISIFNKKQKEYNKEAKERAKSKGQAKAEAKQKSDPDYKYHIKVIEE